MVRLREGYCIDSTEVTRADYQAWLATNPSVRDQNQSDCGWNTSFAPDTTCLGLSYVCQGSGCASHPQVCVDWCDAYAYCKSVGKRMCGRIGGGTNGFTDDDNPALSQWYNACSSHGQNEFPYGSAYDAQACNGDGLGVGTTVPVATLTRCQSQVPGYAGVYDLDGNGYEWEDSCIGTGDAAFCRLRGGSFISQEEPLRCWNSGYAARNTQYGTFGIRCCSP
jgi:formylglycine-generating enzyme required for sulfatase activity